MIQHVLFLTPWYPYRQDPMLGLFVRKQAFALSKSTKTGVVAVFAAEQKEKYIFEHELFGQSLPEIRVFFRKSSSGLTNVIRTMSAYRKGVKAYVEKYGVPELIHGNIFTRTAVASCRIARKLGIPFVVSEHWSRYYPENYSYTGFLRKATSRRVARRAKAVIVPSEALKNAMIASGIRARYETIPNVIDSELFIPAMKKKCDKKHIVHVSCFEDKSKNISGLLKSIQLLLKYRNDFILDLVGTGQDEEKMRKMVSEKLPEGVVEFHGMLEGADLHAVMSQADFLVLSSRYETFGIVVFESLSCGVPVVVTDVAGFGGIISTKYGMVVKPDDDEALAKAMNDMLENASGYDRVVLRDFIEKNYSAEAVVNRLIRNYDELMT
jgi:glycosyltransferase involved in cell wall biosynthesis